MKTITILIYVALVATLPCVQAEEAPPDYEVLSFKDENKDGINDVFRDGNGDGVNDITGKKYHFLISFIDKNDDGINDIFVDANGDGKNDLVSKNIIRRRSITMIFVLDSDRNGLNDVTGEAVKTVKSEKSFIDEDGDGIDDSIRGQGDEDSKGKEANAKKDRFVDEDGDGINDGRGFSQERRMHGSEQGQSKGRGRGRWK